MTLPLDHPMTLTATDRIGARPETAARVRAASRDTGIDTLRGIAIVMVMGIHSLPQPLNSWETLIDAVLRPCVPIFLFASGYLTALSGRVPLGKRLSVTLVPYGIAFVAAYIYMAAHNPAMDHRIVTTLARFSLAYVFVYYYVFVYVGCTVALWLVWPRAAPDAGSERRLAGRLLLAILFGLIAGSYLDPLLWRLGFADALVEEVRMRDIPFWFAFMALGALVGRFGIRSHLADMRMPLIGATLVAYAIYAAVRLYGLGDAADYDSTAFFGYAALLCLLLLAFDAQLPWLAALGSGSYFLYLWHIFIIMALRDFLAGARFGATAGFVVTYAITLSGSILALLAVRSVAPLRLSRWLGA